MKRLLALTLLSFSPLAGIRYAETEIGDTATWRKVFDVSVPLRGLDMRKLK